jgi:MFS transporter, FSR family, fosmidomycin resistance protein
MVPVYSGNKTGFAMSVFNTGGTLAFGLGPLFITWYAVRYGLAAVPFTMLIGLLVCIYLFTRCRRPKAKACAGWGSSIHSRESGRCLEKCVFHLAGDGAAGHHRSIFLTFMPVLICTQGLFPGLGRRHFRPLYRCGNGQRSGRRPFVRPCGVQAGLYFLSLAHGADAAAFSAIGRPWVYLGAVLAGGSVLATMPLGVAMAQILAPKGRSMVASLMMGLAFGLGGIVSPLVGKLADLYSIHAVLNIVALAPLLTLPLIFAFPRVKQ